jgi:hypothetical protein
MPQVENQPRQVRHNTFPVELGGGYPSGLDSVEVGWIGDLLGKRLWGCTVLFRRCRMMRKDRKVWVDAREQQAQKKRVQRIGYYLTDQGLLSLPNPIPRSLIHPHPAHLSIPHMP